MSGKALDISDGGTSQTTAPGARVALGLEIGVNVQAYDPGIIPAGPDLIALEALAGTGIAVRTAANTWATRTLTGPAAGFTITDPAGVAGNPTFVLANDLAALEALAGTGLAVHTGTSTWIERTLTGTAAEITVTNGTGVSGNPTLSLPTALTFTGKTVTGGTYTGISATITSGSVTGITDITVADGGTGSSTAAGARTNLGLVPGTDVQTQDATLNAFAAYNTAGLITQTAADTFTGRTITGTAAEITATNGSGVSGNPTLSLPTSLTFTGKTVTGGTYTGGTFTTGAFNGTVGATTPGTGAFTTLSASTSLLLAGDPIYAKSIAAKTATTSGTSIDFTGIPSTATRITLNLDGVSTNGTSVLIVQLGDAGGIETTGYVNVMATINSASPSTNLSTTGFQFPVASATATRSGTIQFNLLDAATFMWGGFGNIAEHTAGTIMGITSGRKATSAVLDRVRLTTVGGVDTFDAGSMNISWE